MMPLHIHERSARVVLYEAIKRSLYNQYAEMNASIEELEVKGAEDLVRA